MPHLRSDWVKKAFEVYDELEGAMKKAIDMAKEALDNDKPVQVPTPSDPRNYDDPQYNWADEPYTFAAKVEHTGGGRVGLVVARDVHSYPNNGAIVHVTIVDPNSST